MLRPKSKTDIQESQAGQTTAHFIGLTNNSNSAT